MKLKHILIALLACLLVLSAVACDSGAPEETTPSESQSTEAPAATEAPTEKATEPATEAPTEAPETEAPVVTDAPETETPEVVKKYREDWDENDPENPYYNLIPVGKSYDGKTTCYDGRYDFGFAVCQTNDGEYFYSVQEAAYHLDEIGGGNIHMIADTGVCLYIEFPDDGFDYRLYFEFKNVDFVFDYGQIYDDCTPNAAGINGYGYYADLFKLDEIHGLGNTNIWLVKPNETLTDVGRYLLIDEYNDDPDYWYMYQYEQDGNLEDWPGLPNGEVLPE